LISPWEGRMGGWSRASRSMTSASTGRFSDYNKLWHYYWISLVHLPSQDWLDEVRAWRVSWTLAKLALSANNNLSDNALADDLKRHWQCHLLLARRVC
jgi:hypothetical protein